jgi:hypothetical protein
MFFSREPHLSEGFESAFLSLVGPEFTDFSQFCNSH